MRFNWRPDFHAIFEVFLENNWWLIDPTRLALIEGIVRIGSGRDASDIAFSDFGQAVSGTAANDSGFERAMNFGDRPVQEVGAPHRERIRYWFVHLGTCWLLLVRDPRAPRGRSSRISHNRNSS
jgi:hypothetical protein